MSRKYSRRNLDAGNYTVVDDDTLDSIIEGVRSGAIDFMTANYYATGGN